MPDEIGTITRLLDEVHEGREGAMDGLIERVHDDLERIAARRLRARFGPDLAGVTLEPGALVNETYLRLIKQRNRYDNRGQFFAVATRLMLRVLMNHQRSRRQLRRGGGQVRVSLSGVADRVGEESSIALSEFVDVLDRLEALDSRAAEVVKLRLIWGLTVAETARAMDVSVATVEREWAFARKWIAVALKGEAR